MPTDQCQQIIMLYRLRDRARRSIAAHQKAGNRNVAELYTRIDDWLAVQMSYAMAGRRG